MYGTMWVSGALTFCEAPFWCYANMLCQGAAVGGGAELTTCTDYRVATPGASVAFVQVCIPSDAGQGYH